MRTECLACDDNKIEKEGDAFCKSCDPFHFICCDCQMVVSFATQEQLKTYELDFDYFCPSCVEGEN